jgi:hypothetical protein
MSVNMIHAQALELLGRLPGAQMLTDGFLDFPPNLGAAELLALLPNKTQVGSHA